LERAGTRGKKKQKAYPQKEKEEEGVRNPAKAMEGGEKGGHWRAKGGTFSPGRKGERKKEAQRSQNRPLEGGKEKARASYSRGRREAHWLPPFGRLLPSLSKKFIRRQEKKGKLGV